MVSLNTLRTKFSAVLLIVIGFALLAFIVGMKDDVGFSNNDPEVGEISGEDVHYSEFSAAYGDIKALMGGDEADYNQTAQLIAMTWESLLADQVLVPGLEDLGLAVTDAECEVVLAQFKENPNYPQFEKLLKRQVRKDAFMNKFTSLVAAGAYANSLALNKGVAAANNTYKGRFVVCTYASVADSLVTVSESEMKRYYKANQAKYKQTPYRTVNYVTFEADPTDADKKAVEEQAQKGSVAFAAATDLNSYVRNESHASLANSYVAASSLSSEEAAALRAGKMFGPELQGDEWYASRAIENCNAPETLELQHIALSYNDSKLADSLYNAVRQPKADFAALATQFSIAGSRENGGVIGEVKFSDLAIELAEALKSATVNKIVKVEFGGAIQIFKVLKVGAASRYYRLATLAYPVVASSETLRAIHKDASEFAVKAYGSVDKFNEAVKAKSIMSSSMNVQRGSRNVPGLANSIEVVRWANEAKVGDVSELIKIDNNYVVAVLTAIDNEEYKPLSKVSEEVKRALLREKKAELLKNKMQGATLEEVAASAEAKVETFADAKSSAYHVQGLGFEPRVLSSLASVSAENKGALLPLVDGTRGVFAVVVDEVATGSEQTLDAERVKVQAEEEAKAKRSVWTSLRNAAEIVDNAVNFF